MKTPFRVGIYVDDLFAIRDGRVVAPPAAFPFARFACAVGEHLGTTTIIGRAGTLDEGASALPAGTALVSLPGYSALTRIGEVVRAFRGTASAMWRSLDELDGVWVFGPHPFGLMLLAMAAVRRKKLALGVRQETVAYFAARRAPGPKGSVLMGVGRGLHVVYQLLARRMPLTAVGEPVARTYGGPNARVEPMVVATISEEEIPETPPVRTGDGFFHVLTVGRLEPEKNPLLLLDAIADLVVDKGLRLTVTWAGDGSMAEELREEASSRGLGDVIEFPGALPLDPDLIALYRRADLFVHVSLTEGVPQVLLEAMSLGVPIVATAVGGVPGLIGDSGELVPPESRSDLVERVAGLLRDPARRGSLAESALWRARKLSRERESARVGAFLASRWGVNFSPRS